MSLLELERVAKRHRHARHACDTLVDVSLTLEPGELLAVWGQRHSGRSTLLRLSAGIEAPDAGAVRFRGADIATSRRGSIPDGIAYCTRPLYPLEAHTVLEQLLSPQLARGIAQRTARARTLQALDRAGAGGCGGLHPSHLDAADAVRVNIARALTAQPTLLLIDEPTNGVDLLERDGIIDLLRSLTREQGIAVLTCVAESASLYGADRALTLSEGELHGELAPYHAAVLDLPLRASG